jgi:hypothetical protein
LISPSRSIDAHWRVSKTSRMPVLAVLRHVRLFCRTFARFLPFR